MTSGPPVRRFVSLSEGSAVAPVANESARLGTPSTDWMFQALLANLDGMVYRCRDDADWTMEFVSEGCTRLTGYAPEHLLLNGRVSYEELTHPDDRDPVREMIHAAVEQGRRFQVEYRIQHADGRIRWVWEHGVGVRDESGRVVAIEGIVEDITARVESEQALREAERSYRSLFDNAIEGIFRTTPDGRYLDANPALARIYGFATPQELVSSLHDIESQLYADPGRREEFMRIVKARGEISGFESRVYRKNGDTIWISENARAVFDDEGRVLHYEGTVEDITERRQNQARIEQQANYDSLTGLANRSLLNDRLQQAIYTAASYGARLAVVFVDLDRFKYVNDTLGHDVGDRLLQVMAERLTAAVAESDTVARLGGDEFVLLLHGHAGPDTVAAVLERLLPTVAAPLRYGQNDLDVTCSIGVALYPDDGTDSATLLKHADSAMYRAKEQGRNNFQFFTEDLNRAMKERFDLESQLRRGLERGQFELHYQPRVDLTTRKIIGAEALLRWHVPGRGLVSPATFIPVAEEIGIIGQISEWVLHAACVQNKRWLDAGLSCVVSVNVSPQQFRGDGLLPLIKNALADSGLDPGCLEIEITESTVMDAGERMVETLHAIKKLGVHIAIDDFGTGYSSLSYLKRFPVDRLKVDRSFVQHMDDADDAVIVRAIIALGHNLGLKVLAEGVETEEQLAFLHANGCDELQGYLISKPVSAWQMTKLLTAA
jgi:diguanylate cyclase (GGDEF)-like protein/PAS domain S-box-containing protein